MPWWGWLLIVLVIILLALLICWWLRRRAQAKAKVACACAAAPKAPVAAKPDDLKLIEGIGPKISNLLQAAGIMTFAQLAATDVERLRQILQDAGLGALADPTTWAEQAELAAAGKWDLLETLQGQLKGGRRAG